MNFYKILNEEECHYGLQYKTGLNIDPIEFNPSGDCQPGGIYFAKENILAFLHVGHWIRKVTIPEDAQIYENPGEPKKWKADKIILGEREEINLKVIKRLIDEGANPKIGNNYPLKWAATSGHIEIVKFLFPFSNSKTSNSTALKSAALRGHLEIVKFLLPVSNPKANNSAALRYAAWFGHLEIVKLLIPVSDSKAQNSEALRWAAENGYTEIVKLLIPVSDIKANNSEALRLAIHYNHIDTFKILISYLNVKIYNIDLLKLAIYKNHLEIIKILIPLSEINDEIINYCETHCKNQEIINLMIIADKSI